MDSGFNLSKFGKRVTELREKRGYTLFELAVESEFEQGLLETLEEGKLAPSMMQVKSLADTLNVTQEFLLGLTTDEESKSKTNGDGFSGRDTHIELLEMVLSNDTGWHTRGFLAPSEIEKEILREGLKFQLAPPRELIQFYWDVAPLILARLRARSLNRRPHGMLQ
jgi:transcriptional regulator with XRE-family HTH domain